MSRALWLILAGGILAGTASAQLEGRVVLSGFETSDVLVTLQRETGQIVHQAFTSSRGTFRVEGVNVFTVSNNNPYELVISAEGYKTYRQRIKQQDLRSGGSLFTVFLEPEDATITTTDGDAEGNLTVDVRQLQVEIPLEAFEDFEAAAEDSAIGNHERAAERLERAVEMAPDYYDAWIDLGGQYDQLGRYDDAKSAYLEAGRVNPAGALAELNLGILYYQQGERERAQAGERDGRDAGGQDGQVDAASDDGFASFRLARESLERALVLNPISVEARVILGTTLYRMNLYDEAEDFLRSAILLDEGQVDARIMLINVYSRQNRYPAALEQVVDFLEGNPGAPERAAIERVRSQLEDALNR